MPANLTPEYRKAEVEYRKAVSPEDKLSWVQVMLRVIPKHKGTDHLQGDLKKRISQLKKEVRDYKKSKAKRHEFHVEKHGAAQIVLVGSPNAGKSQLLATLTNARPEVADYMFTTREPIPGMLQCEDVQIELVDLPSVSEEYTPHWVFNIIRNADAIFLVFDLSSDSLLEQLETTVKLVEEKKIKLLKEIPEPDNQDIHNAYIQTLILANKFDMPNAEENLKIFNELYQTDIMVLPVSSVSGKNLDFFKSHELLDTLNLIRIYSKAPSKEPEFGKPFVLKKESTVMDFANKVHNDFADNIKFARVWGSGKFDGQQIDSKYILHDKDIVEIHM